MGTTAFRDFTHVYSQDRPVLPAGQRLGVGVAVGAMPGDRVGSTVRGHPPSVGGKRDAMNARSRSRR